MFYKEFTEKVPFPRKLSDPASRHLCRLIAATPAFCLSKVGFEKVSFSKKPDFFRTLNEVFDYIINNLKPSNMLWSYFVNWNKVFDNVKDIVVDQLQNSMYVLDGNKVWRIAL